VTSPETELPNASPAPSSENLVTIPEEVQAPPFPSSVSQSQHRSSLAEWITAAFTVVLALATLALVVTAIYQHIDALDAIQATTGIARTGEKLFIAGQRAWVSCHVVMDEDLTYDVNGARFTLGCILNNTGHSPARKVFFTHQHSRI
jgi:hypothetical protein